MTEVIVNNREINVWKPEFLLFRRQLGEMPFLGEILSVWSLRLYSLLHLTNFSFVLPYESRYEGTNKAGRAGDDFSSLVVFAIWFLLYYSYKKFLDSVLRKMRYPMIERKRLIDGLWCCTFSVCGMFFLAYFASDERDCPWRRDKQPAFFIHKAFYLHRAAVEAFSHGSWLRGWSSQLFASSMPASSSKKWHDALVTLLFYKACDMTLLTICRLLMTLSRARAARRVAKFIFMLHFLNWFYLHIFLVPGFLLFDSDSKFHFQTRSSLWMWLICELLTSIRYNEFGCMYTKQTLEMTLFPRPSEEAVEFVNILKKHRSSIDHNRVAAEPSAQKKKTELWQTIVCAMAMKKKLKKLRDNKRIQAPDEDSLNSHKAVNEMYGHS